ncbi:ankyrin repeat-containing protein [Fusarium sp. NRRL 52700]|nr:ankyrin repeat-containing protein [Fusarium sp. NRRL 52700]
MDVSTESRPVGNNPWNRDIGMNTDILEPGDSLETCPNAEWYAQTSLARRLKAVSEFQASMKLPRPSDTKMSRKDQLFRIVFAFFHGLGLKKCFSPYCDSFRQRLNPAVPLCRWEQLRESVMTLVGCWFPGSQNAALELLISRIRNPNASLSPETVPHSTPLSGIDIGRFIFSRVLDGPHTEEDTQVMMEVISVIDWLRYLWVPESIVGRQAQWESQWPFIHDLRLREHIREAIKAIQEPCFQRLNICPHWIWNLAVSRGGQYDSMQSILCHLLEPCLNFQPLRKRHDDCNEQMCLLANEESTGASQLHKCQAQDCPVVQVNVDILADAYRAVERPIPWLQTAWDISDRPPEYRDGEVSHLRLAEFDDAYMAVSHVWSDGTGVGARKQGEVNSCLLEYWSSIAGTLGCKGLWWDSICLPIHKDSRRKALDIMLENFEKAKYLVIHDQDLASLPYPGRHEAAIAIVLSTWFTRGWTAAELYSCRKGDRKIKFIFKHPVASNDIGPFLVDIEDIIWDEDSLTETSRHIPILAEMSASRIIKELLVNIENFSGLKRILETRSTTWEKDRVVVASLLVLQKTNIDSSMTTPQLTRSILSELGDFGIQRTAIFHDQIPMTRYGGWSWCPPSMFDMDKDYRLPRIDPNNRDELTPLVVTPDGVAEGFFAVFPVRRQDCDNILPVSSHPAVIARCLAALEEPGKCMILKVGLKAAKSHLTLGVLVSPVRGSCRYIACVYSIIPLDVDPILMWCSIGRDVDELNVPLPILFVEDMLSTNKGLGLP